MSWRRFLGGVDRLATQPGVWYVGRPSGVAAQQQPELEHGALPSDPWQPLWRARLEAGLSVCYPAGLACGLLLQRGRGGEDVVPGDSSCWRVASRRHRAHAAALSSADAISAHRRRRRRRRQQAAANKRAGRCETADPTSHPARPPWTPSPSPPRRSSASRSTACSSRSRTPCSSPRSPTSLSSPLATRPPAREACIRSASRRDPGRSSWASGGAAACGPRSRVSRPSSSSSPRLLDDPAG